MRAWMVLIAVAAAGGGLYLYQNPDAIPWLEQRIADTGLVEDGRTLYRWRDAEGVWQVTDTPPPKGTEYERVQYPSDANVMPAPSVDDEGR